MNRTRRGTTRIHAGIWTVLLALLLTATPSLAVADPGTNKGRGEERRSERASAALEAAQDLFRGMGRSRQLGPEAKARRPVAPSADNHATLVLRDLAVSLDDLGPADRRIAQRILARPTNGFEDTWPGVKYDGAPSADTCSLPDQAQHKVCIHWVTDPADVNAPPPAGADEQGVPAWVRTNQRVFDEVWQKVVVDLGYRRPVPDLGTADHELDARTDIYLAELGPTVYGYCAPDYVEGRVRSYPAYCVVDNDFAEFPGTPMGNLQVTAAHEFFHAVQFAYSIFGDSWLMEGTAAWVEDEVYDAINDNLQYLARSALSAPNAPLDYVAADDSADPDAFAWRYGSWIWWRFLTEYFGSRTTTDPSVVREVWQRLAAGQGPLEAGRTVLQRRDTTFREVFADFGAVNRIARLWYDEGASYARFVAPAERFTLTRSRRGFGWKTRTLDHLSSRHEVIRPGKGLAGRWRLRVDLDLPPRLSGSEASVMMHRRDGRIRWLGVTLDRHGDARFAVAFDRRTISYVALSLTNASTRMSGCNDPASPFTCHGWSPDDGGRFGFRASAVR